MDGAPSVTAARVSGSPRIEHLAMLDRLDGSAATSDFRQMVPGDGQPASQRTQAQVTFDDANLYVAFLCEDDPALIRVGLSRREAITDDDRVAVYLDTFMDRQRTYIFEANALGVQRDAVRAEGQKEDVNFDALWASEGRLTASGYVVLFTVPFKSLRFTRADSQNWGLALRRTIVRRNEESYWPRISNRVQGFVTQFGQMLLPSVVQPGRNIALIPYVSAFNARLLNSSAAAYTNDRNLRGGLSAKGIVRNALTVDLAINPDFSQVESDDPQVTVNQRFEVFFPERRPFFIENANYFQTPINLFFSRRISDPEFGGRLTGKIGSWAMGALVSDDRAPGKRLAGTDPRSGDRAVAGVFRLRREFGAQNSIGVLASDREFGGDFSRVVSVDSRVQLSPTWLASAQLAKSETRRGAQASPFDGTGIVASISRSGRSLALETRYVDLSPGFRSDLGFIRRTDIRTLTQSAGYRWWTGGGRLQSFGPSFAASVNHDHAGRLQDWSAYADLSFLFSGQTEVKVARTELYEYYLRGFRKNRTEVSAYTGRWKRLFTYGSFGKGTEINYVPSSGLPVYLGSSADASFTAAYRPFPQLRFDQTYLYSRLSTLPGRASIVRDGTIFTNHLLRTKMNYQFTRRLSLRLIVDYYALLPDEGLIEQTPFKRVSADALFVWQLNPWTAFYFGVLDRYENVDLEPLTSQAYRRGPPNASAARQVSLKFSYYLPF
jgi:hypothetical protein